MADQGTVTAQRRYDWDYLVSRSGDAGRDWMLAYARPEHAAIVEATDQALALCLQRRFAPARGLLDEAGARLAALPEARASIVHVLERWVHGVSAYHDYCVEDYEPARRGLDLAAEAIRAAVDQDRFLLPLAHHCHEFHLHHARIARNRRRWPEMREHLGIVRAMLENRAPLCVLGDGTEVGYAQLARHCATLPDIPAEAQASLTLFSDQALRSKHHDRFILALYLLPGVVIPSTG
jgi:hypothetical protein